MKPLRQTMPETAAFIDAMRDAFGADLINPAIKSGIDGQPTFWARENGIEVGTRAPYSAEKAVKASEIDSGSFNATAAQETRQTRGK